MREILFRAQRAKEGSGWVYGSYIDMGDDTDQAFIYEKMNGASTYTCQQLVAMHMILIIKKTVGQFTNNHDYYTKEELFEGDVMERDGKRFVIKFNGCGFVGEQIGKPNFLLSLCLLCHLTSEFRLPGKKIGNIHDNPELLEVK